MVKKFGRIYNLKFEIDTTTTVKDAVEIRDPLTLQFNIIRNTSSTLNSATFEIFNLNETNRELIFQNKTSINDASGKRRRVLLQAGYDDSTTKKRSNLATIFTGDLLEAYSYRAQGSTNVITYINALDGGFAAYNSTINKTFEKGTSLKQLATEMVSSLKGLKTGAIGDIQGAAKTSSALNQNSFYLLNRDYEDKMFIDLETVNILDKNEYIKSIGGKVPLIDSESGLLGTPQRQGTDLVVEMLFEPNIIVGQIVQIKSQFNKKFDGQYKVNGVKHSGIISGAVTGKCTTTLQLYIGDKLLGELKGV